MQKEATMGFRFRRSIRVAPGIHINLGKTGVHETVGIPGTGLSYRTGNLADGHQAAPAAADTRPFTGQGAALGFRSALHHRGAGQRVPSVPLIAARRAAAWWSIGTTTAPAVSI